MPVSGIGGPFDPSQFDKLPSKAHKPAELKGVSVQGEDCYLDMGEFYGNNIWGCMNYYPEPVGIDSSKLQSGFLGQYFNQMKSAGVNKIDLSFAQLCDIKNLLGDTSGSPASYQSYSKADAFGQIFHNQDASGQFTQGPYGVFDYSKNPPEQVSPNFLSYLIQQAKSNGIQVDLSFGGASAGGGGAPDMKLPGDPAECAKNLSDMMNNLGINSVDFDIENPSIFQLNSQSDLDTFFSTLHSLTAQNGQQSTVTLEGGVITDPNYTPLLSNFDSKFDSVNLMLYSNTQYYVDANNPTWGIEQWMDQVHLDPSQIHIGFYTAIDYTQAKSSAGGAYNIKPGSSNGQAAAQIFQQLTQQLQTDGYLKQGDSLGKPFFWEDTPGDPKSAQMMQDFNNTLQGISKTPWG